MTQTVQHRRRIAGAAGSPAAVGSKEGEISLNFRGAAGAGSTAEAWAYDGAAWVRLNPDGVSPNVKGITVTGATVEAGFNAGAGTVVAAGDIVIATHAGTAYVYTGPVGTITTATAGQFTALGAATPVATPAQIRAGADNAAAVTSLGLKAVLPAATLAAGVSGAQAGHPTNPLAATGVVGDAGRIVILDGTGHIASAVLDLATVSDLIRGISTNKLLTPDDMGQVLSTAAMSAGVTSAQPRHPTNTAAATGVVADANRIVVLDATGHIPAAFLSVTGFDFQSADLTAAPVGANLGHQNGRIVVNSAAAVGALNALWTPTADVPSEVGPSDMLLSDGTTWHVITTDVDLARYLPLIGGTITQPVAAAGAVGLTFDMTNAVPAVGGNKIAIDLGTGEITNGIIDGGTF